MRLRILPEGGDHGTRKTANEEENVAARHVFQLIVGRRPTEDEDGELVEALS